MSGSLPLSLYPPSLSLSTSHQGRLLVFECLRNDQRTALRLVHEKEIKGAPNSLSTLSGKLVACVNRYIFYFEHPLFNLVRKLVKMSEFQLGSSVRVVNGERTQIRMFSL